MGISWGPLLTPALGQCPSAQMVSPPLNKTWKLIGFSAEKQHILQLPVLVNQPQYLY
ncbi:unnamed protein product [Staurois parvus]|uniref:Uncharacterized protein n=1 Tax=Staurois parvus TaxID=386267 RepID=A0ABN9BX18_9NEOB|nr:unnamed protein product [Staurois parvus]